ncbi:MAG: UbiA family prenyltransferase [Thermodesulfobacteriota bacterium]
MKSAVDVYSINPTHRVSLIQSLRIFAGIVRLHITAIAAMGVFTFGWLFTGRYPWFLTAVCALDWFIVNLMNRVVDLQEDRLNNIRHTVSVYRHRKALLILSITLLVASLAAVHLVNPAITPLRIAGHLLGIFYNWPLLPGKRRLKETYFWKNTASGAGFLITVFGYPLASTFWNHEHHLFPPGITWTTVLLTALFFFLFIQSYEILYDLRDIKGDVAGGVRTYPAVHGKQMAVHMIDGLIVASALVLASGYVLKVVPWRIFIMVAAPVLQIAVYKYALHRQELTAGCIRLTWMGAALFCIYHLWVLADLPGTEF